MKNKMERNKLFLFYAIISTYLHMSNGCAIDGRPNWVLPETKTILDIDTGIFYNRSTSGIDGINSVSYREGLNSGPYVVVSLVNSELILSTNNDYTNYEELETALSMGLTINFRCADSSSRNLVFNINIQDTNNNDPQFKPSNTYEVTIAPPVPPNFLITNCISDIIVRDIDLTTQRIDFTLEGSSLFEIAYDNSTSVPKEFKAILRTTSFIRSIPEPITLTITATDVDLTGDPQRTATATVKILADSEFELPDEPIFSQTFYIADYTTEDEIILRDPIYLRQGYDSQVKFSLEGQFSERIELIENENQVTFKVISALPEDTYEQREIYLVVKAQRNFTSGADATIILVLPPDRELSFEKSTYSGTLEDNVTEHEAIVLNVGYNDDVTFQITGLHVDFFSVRNTLNRVFIETRRQLSENIIMENNFMVLDLSASSLNAVTTTTTILLEIIKEDSVTPVFNQHIYNGIYIDKNNINIESISLYQGYDDTVTFDLIGDHAKYFTMDSTTNNIFLTLNSTIPEDLIFTEKVLVFNAIAEKSRTVGANTAVVLKFPEELTEPTILKFNKNNYNGSLEDGILTIEEIILETGFITSETKFVLSGELSRNFIIANINNVVNITLSSTVSMEELTKNNFIVLEIEATRTRAVPATVNVIIDIPKDVIVFTVFEKSFYSGSYTEENGLIIEEITLEQGFDTSVTFTLEGESSQWFTLLQNANAVTLSINETNSITDDIINENDYLLFNVVANKPGTIGGRAVIHIHLPKEPVILRFEKNYYIGRIENSSLYVEEIRLLDFNVSLVELIITGDYASYFKIIKQSAAIAIEILEIPNNVIENNNIITLVIEASQSNAINGHTTIILNIVNSQESQIELPIFEQAYYTGEYSNSDGLIFLQTIKLTQGIHESVTFELEGDDSQWFYLVEQDENSFTLSLKNENLQEVTNKSLLVFTVVARKRNSESARATIIISIIDLSTVKSLYFSKDYYTGYFENGDIVLETINFHQDDPRDVNITLRGGEIQYVIETDGAITIKAINEIPADIILSTNLFVFTLEANAQDTRAHTIIVLEIKRNYNTITKLSFESAYYIGSYSEENGLIFESEISLVGGFDEFVRFELDGENSIWFSINKSGDSINLSQSNAVEQSVLQNNHNLVFTINAEKDNISTSAAIILEIVKGEAGNTVLSFEETSYIGSINETTIILSQIMLKEGYSENVSFAMRGEHAIHFTLLQEEAILTISINGTIPEEILSVNNIIVLELEATAPYAMSAFTIIVLDVKVNEMSTLGKINFDRTYYKGHYTVEGTIEFSQNILLANGYDGTINFSLEGEHKEWFQVQQTGNSATIIISTPIPPTILATNQVLIFEVLAESDNSDALARAVIVITHDYGQTEVNVSFDRVLYNGKLQDNVVTHDTISLSGFVGSTILISGEYASLFDASFLSGIVTVRSTESATFSTNLTHIALTLQAGYASSVLILDIIDSGSEPAITETFDKILYTGNLENGVVVHETINIVAYSGSNIEIIGEYANLFESFIENGVVTIRKISSVLQTDVTHIALTLQAGRANAVLLLDVINSESQVAFDQVLYKGRLYNGVVSHENISLSGNNEANIQILGDYGSSFVGSYSNGVVTISTTSSAVFPNDLTHIALTLQANGANAVLLLEVLDSGISDLPTVTFSRTSYFLWADVNQTGVVGRVQASADNGEIVSYSLTIDDEYLRERITINNEGEILLSAEAQSGVYSFIVKATAQNSRVEATASVLLRVEALPECGTDIALPPLIVLERLEEEPHRNLVVLNQTENNCRYNLLSRWPADQSWLYVDEEGLHARAIDREDESIAFMTLSQIQVELTLYCDSDVVPIAKRSFNAERLELGTDEYGSNKWILADTIVYDAKRTVVNLIVNDINDNSPIFVGKENEPMYVGYPVHELEETILPRALAELKATDADIGENAALVYWSTEENLAIAPQAGSVHVRNNARLENNSRLTIYATDQNGMGLNGSLDIVVKLLDKNKIAVMSIRDAFLDDEDTVLSNISDAIGYELKVLRSVVISDNSEESSRKKRDISSASGSSLQLYIYGLYESEPVDVAQLTSDISNSNIVAVNIARIQSLEDHLEAVEICPLPGRDTGFFIATIVLAVLLLILIMAISAWFLMFSKHRINLKCKEKKDYEQFSDNNSVASRNNETEKVPNVEILSKPRLNIEELKRSERRLQEMLDVPIREIAIEQTNITEPKANERKPQEMLEGPLQEIEPDKNMNNFNDAITPSETTIHVSALANQPIVIQSIDKLKDNDDGTDDEDEFGENKIKPRKSVVTFNENVEKIIHLEDDYEDSPEPNFEVYKF